MQELLNQICTCSRFRTHASIQRNSSCTEQQEEVSCNCIIEADPIRIQFLAMFTGTQLTVHLQVHSAMHESMQAHIVRATSNEYSVWNLNTKLHQLAMDLCGVWKSWRDRDEMSR